jgi:hypothetical protein
MSPYLQFVQSTGLDIVLDSLALQLLYAQACKQWQAAMVHCLYIDHGRVCVIPK